MDFRLKDTDRTADAAAESDRSANYLLKCLFTQLWFSLKIQAAPALYEKWLEKAV